jgi:hypothetical protein
VSEIDKDLNPFFDDLVGLLTLDIGYKTNATGIVLVFGVIESLGLR